MLDNYPYLDIYYPYIDSMKSSELPLFEYENDLIRIPTGENLPENTLSKLPLSSECQEGIYEQVNYYFQNQDLDLRNIDFIRSILGETSSQIDDFELSNYATEVQCLVDEWADEFEKQLFDQPLQQLLGIK